MSCDNIHISHPMVTASLPSFNEALSDTFYDSLPSHEPDNGGAVEIDTGDGDVSAVLKYVVANAAYTKGLKSSPVWKYFAHFDAVQHPDKKNHRICLLCRELGIDKSISVGKDYSNTPLISHLQSKHKEEFKEFLAAKNSTAPQSGSSQAQIGSFFSKKSEIKEKFKRYFAKFVVDECLPLTICRSPSLKDMVRCINKQKQSVTDRQNELQQQEANGKIDREKQEKEVQTRIAEISRLEQTLQPQNKQQMTCSSFLQRVDTILLANNSTIEALS